MNLKKLLAIVLCVAMVFSTISFSVSATEGEEIFATAQETTAVATIDGTPYETLQAAIDAAYTAGGEVTVTLSEDITENVTIKEKTGFYLTLEGADKTFNGTITISALSDINDNRRTTIKNVDFVTSTGVDFIKSAETNHYPRLTVENCDFTGTGNDDTVAIRTKSAYDLIIKDCTGTNLHSFLQNTSGVGVTVEKITITDSKGGLAMGTAQNVAISGCDITTRTYGIRLDAVLDTTATLDGNTVNAYIPVSVRNAKATEYQLNFDGDTSSYTATNEDNVWCAVCIDEYEEGTELNPPTGDIKIEYNTDALNAFGVYGAYTPPIGIVQANGTITAYASLAEALEAAADGATIIVNSPDEAIDANGKVVGNKTVTITGNAKFNWRAGWLFVGRGGEGNGKLIFKNANITTDNTSYAESTGLYVSTTEFENGTDITDKNFGEVEIIDSNIQLAYLRQQNNVTVDNSELCVYGGFSVAGRIGSETESGEDSTATMTIKNNSSVVVKNSNGMGIGYSESAEGAGIVNLQDSSFICEQGTMIGPKATFNIAGNVTVNVPSGRVVATGDVTFEGKNQFGVMGIESYTFTIGKDATVAMTDTTRPVLGHGATVNIEGNITDAKTADATIITPSLYIAGGASITGNGVTFNAKDAYVKFGTSNGVSSKNSAARGTFDFGFENCIVDFTTQQLTLSEPKNGLTPNFNFNFKDSAVATTNKLCIAADNTEITLDNTSFETASQFRNDGILTLKNGSYLKATMSQPGENNGNAGTIIVDDSKLDIIMANEHVAMGKADAATLTLKNGAEAIIPYIMNTSISVDGTSKLSTTKLISDNTIAIDATNLNRGENVTVVEQTADNAESLEDIVTVTNAPYVTTSYENGDVVMNGIIMVTTYEELVAAFEKDNANVIMMNDITGTATQNSGYDVAGLVLNAGDVLDGNGYKLTINGANNGWKCGIAMKGGTVKNLTIARAFRGVFMPGANGDVIIDNCTFDDVIYTFNSDSGSKDYGVTIKNTTLNGWTSFSNAHKFVVFENCTFGEGNGYQFCRPYQGTTFTNCEFNEGFEFDANKVKDSNPIEFTDCTYDGVAFSAETAAIMFYNGGTVVIDEQETVFQPVVAVVDGVCFADIQSAVDACPENGTVTIKKDGTYTFPSMSGKTFTLKADDGVESKFEMGTSKPNLGGSNVTFENITFNWDAKTDYKGLQHNGDMTYNNCTINGKVFLYGTSEIFNNCTFNQQVVDYNVWTYSAGYVEFNGCTFNSVGKSVLVYHEGANVSNEIKVTDSTFNASAPCDGKAAIEIDSSLMGNVSIEVDDKTTATGFATGSKSGETLWNVKKVKSKTIVEVADEVVYAHLGGSTEYTHAVATVDGEIFATLQEAFDKAEDGDTITLLDDVILEGQNINGYYEGIYYEGDKNLTVDLGGFTVTNDTSVNDYLMLFKNTGSKANEINIINGTLKASSSAYCAICTSSASTQQITVNLENVNVVGNHSYGSVIKVRGGTVLNVNDGTVITGKDSYLGIECIASTANIYDGTEIYMNGTTSYNGCLAGVGGNGTINVYGGYGKGVKGGFIAMTSGGTINVYGGEWIADTDNTNVSGNDSVLIAQSQKSYYVNSDDSVVNVEGGCFTGGYNCYGDAEGDAQIIISGGTFSVNPEQYVDTQNYTSYENADGTYSVVAGRSLEVYTWADEVYAGERVTVAIKVVGDNMANASWTLEYNPEEFKLVNFEETTGTINDSAWQSVAGDVYANGADIIRYDFEAIAQDIEIDSAFNISNTYASTWVESFDGTKVIANNNGSAVVKILLRDYNFEQKFDGNTITENNATVSFDGNEHTFEVAPTDLADTVTYSVKYKIDGEEKDAVSITEEGIYVIDYEIDAEAGYADKSGTFTLTIDKADYKVEVTDYTFNTKLVLVYTDTPTLRFKYKNTAMIDVSVSRLEENKYLYGGTDEYDYVYGYVVYGAEADYEENITYTGDSAEVFEIDNAYALADINFSNTLNVQDITTAYGVSNEHSALFANIKYQKQLLKADVNCSKTVDGADTGYVVSEVKTAMGLR